MSLEQVVTRAWYRRFSWTLLLIPFALIVALVSRRRRAQFLKHPQDSYRASIPVVVVGNITVGGSGKSPLIAHLASSLARQGMKPGIACSGYGSALDRSACKLLSQHSTPAEVGDEAVMLKAMTNCPVAAAPMRALAIKALEDEDCDLILCDDGMQHYRFHRDVEICVLDAQRVWGNGWFLPAGPLRESVSRLGSVDIVVCNGGSIELSTALNSQPLPYLTDMHLKPGDLEPLNTHVADVRLAPKGGQTIHAVAAIGNPERFFKTLSGLGFKVIPHSFPDHHQFAESDFDFPSVHPVIMTQKDAVKCAHFQLQNAWYLPVSVDLNSDVAAWLINHLHLKKPLDYEGKQGDMNG